MQDLTEPRESTVRKLFALSSNHCAFPGCPTSIVDSVHETILGEVCHIRAHNPGGPRFDPHQTAEERHSLENLILLCRNHHKVIDARENLTIYTEAYLFQLKRDHESVSHRDALPLLSDENVAALLETVRTSVGQTTHIDFRGAQLSAGGQGGGPGGGGGGGGVINIVGVTPAGFKEPIQLGGEGGRGGEGFDGVRASGGGGGGGGGVLVFSGREVTSADLESGLRVTSFFMARAIEVQNGLFYVLGGGWEFLVIPELPHEAFVNLGLVIDTGQISTNSLLRLFVDVIAPSTTVTQTDAFDVATPEVLRPVTSQTILRQVVFTAAESGIWQFRVHSGNAEFGRLRLELRVQAGME